LDESIGELERCLADVEAWLVDNGRGAWGRVE
jgi:hypothetical protein